MKNKKLISIISAVSLTVGILGGIGVTAYFNPTVVVNGVTLESELIMKDDRIYVPLRAVSESLGADVAWDEATSTATITADFENDLSGMISQVSNSVVAIVGNYRYGASSHVEATAHGSGVIIKSGGEILTNAHVVKDLEQIIVVMNNGEGYEAKLKYIDEAFDLAVIKINKIGLTPIKYADPSSIVTGKTVVAIGTPVSFSLRNSASKGIISGVNCNVGSDYRLIQTDAAINPGNSGGALVNTKGELMGINSSKFVSSSVEGMGFAIPVDTVRYVLSQFDTYGRVRKINTGIEYEESWAATMGLPTTDGLTVKSVAPGSPAAATGLAPGDVILKIGETPINSRVDYNEALKNYNIGDTMYFTVTHGGNPVYIGITATE